MYSVTVSASITKKYGARCLKEFSLVPRLVEQKNTDGTY
jgi:hypothetical protein